MGEGWRSPYLYLYDTQNFSLSTFSGFAFFLSFESRTGFLENNSYFLWKQERHRPYSLRRGPGGLTLFPRFQSSASLLSFEVLVTSDSLASGGLLRGNQHGQYLPFASIRVLPSWSGQITKLERVCPGGQAGRSPRVLVQMTLHPIGKSQGWED